VSAAARQIPFVPTPGVQPHPHAWESRRTLRAARVHLGRCMSRVQHVTAMREVGVEPTAEDLDTLATDLRMVSAALAATVQEVDYIIQATTPPERPSAPRLRAKVLP
jgi:hypothetical protein